MKEQHLTVFNHKNTRKERITFIFSISIVKKTRGFEFNRKKTVATCLEKNIGGCLIDLQFSRGLHHIPGHLVEEILRFSRVYPFVNINSGK